MIDCISPPLRAIRARLAFVNQVQAFVDERTLTELEGQPLIDAATLIVDGILAGS